MKKLIALLLAAVLLSFTAVSVAEGIIGGPGPMFVYTENGKGLNVRSAPVKEDNIIGSLPYGSQVDVTEFNGEWATIRWGNSYAYVQSRFLQWYQPEAKPTPAPTDDPDSGEAELRNEVPINSLLLQVQASRVSGWVNLRIAPSQETRRVEALTDGTELVAFAETPNWYHVTNPATGNTGYIHKNYVVIVPVPAPSPVVDEVTRIGTLNVNGEFQLQCKVPEGYKLQVMSARGSKIVASLTSDDVSRPQMILNVAYSEMYANVERLNDLSEEEMNTLKASFTDLNEVAFSETETTSGTKLLIARETGSDEDFVSIITLYKGYSVEFLLAPNQDAAQPVLTDAQVQTAIDFLSNLNFIPAN